MISDTLSDASGMLKTSLDALVEAYHILRAMPASQLAQGISDAHLNANYADVLSLCRATRKADTLAADIVPLCILARHHLATPVGFDAPRVLLVTEEAGVISASPFSSGTVVSPHDYTQYPWTGIMDEIDESKTALWIAENYGGRTFGEACDAYRTAHQMTSHPLFIEAPNTCITMIQNSKEGAHLVYAAALNYITGMVYVAYQGVYHMHVDAVTSAGIDGMIHPQNHVKFRTEFRNPLWAWYYADDDTKSAYALNAASIGLGAFALLRGEGCIPGSTTGPLRWLGLLQDVQDGPGIVAFNGEHLRDLLMSAVVAQNAGGLMLIKFLSENDVKRKGIVMTPPYEQSFFYHAPEAQGVNIVALVQGYMRDTIALVPRANEEAVHMIRELIEQGRAMELYIPSRAG